MVSILKKSGPKYNDQPLLPLRKPDSKYSIRQIRSGQLSSMLNRKQNSEKKSVRISNESFTADKSDNVDERLLLKSEIESIYNQKVFPKSSKFRNALHKTDVKNETALPKHVYEQRNNGELPVFASLDGRSKNRMHKDYDINEKVLAHKPQQEKINKKLNVRKSVTDYSVHTAIKKKEDLRNRKRTLVPSKADVRYSDNLLNIDEPVSEVSNETQLLNENKTHIASKTLLKSKADSSIEEALPDNLKSGGLKENPAEIENTKDDPVPARKKKVFKQNKDRGAKTKENYTERQKESAVKQKAKENKTNSPTKIEDINNQTKTSANQNYNENNEFLLVAAIDFGTTYSGYAFSSLREYKKSPMSITAKLWSSPHYNSVKTSTNILFDENGQFHSFGFEAEAKYLRLLEDEDSNSGAWYYFSRFKMMLYQNTNIGINTKLKDNQGKQMSAIKVFSAAIAYLKADLLAMCFQQHAKVSQEQIRWVITVPALWNDKAKTFMREAAKKAGIPNSSLIMALEPEAASLYCIEWMKRSDETELGRGEKFIVLDAGGGTVDIAVHQIQENGRIRELHKANGGDWGGMKVDQEFKKLLNDIMGREVFSELEKQHKSDYFEIFYCFERAKRRDFSIVGHGKVHLTFPSIVSRLCLKIKQKDINDIVSENMKLKNNIRLIRDKLEIDLVLFKSLFSSAISDIINHLTILLRQSQVRDVTTILMVGGYSECYLLQEAIKTNFNSLRVIVPHDSALSVLKGAVLYGHSPNTFQSRISTFTYGIETTEPFSKGHPEDKKISINGKFHCDKIFCIHVRDGENVTLGKSVSKTYRTIDPEQTHMEFIIYASIKKSPKFTDEDGCFRVGTLTVDVTKIATDRHGMKKVKLELIYGGTELEAVAIDKITGKTSRQHFILGPTSRIINK